MMAVAHEIDDQRHDVGEEGGAVGDLLALERSR